MNIVINKFNSTDLLGNIKIEIQIIVPTNIANFPQ